MHTELIDNVEPLADDLAVLAAIHGIKHRTRSGAMMHIALMGLQGNVYRAISTHGLDEFAEVCAVLGDFGFQHINRPIGSPLDALFQMTEPRSPHVKSPKAFRDWQFERLARVEGQIESEQRRVQAMEAAGVGAEQPQRRSVHHERMIEMLHRTIGAFELEKAQIMHVIARTDEADVPKH